MKKILLSVAALSMLIGATVFTSCKKTDTTPPTITVTGANPYTVTLGTTYTDPGAKATDNSGNDLTSSIVTNVSPTNPNMAVAGTYTINYNVTDANGNVATQMTRTVYVQIVATNLVGHWSIADVTDTTVNYKDALTASTTSNMTVWTGAFAGYSGNAVSFVLTGNTGTTINVPQQTVTASSDNISRTYTGSGTVSTDAKTITINYTQVDNSTTPPTTTTGVDTYTNNTGKK
jgi:hypothetical protein